ncbi:hypothetical protein [Polyangium jinanense]|uniref:Uncharacterized protein n=1 Tax=Polyangium jinanense TaxID=2829994 RepID=A0A9X3X528_9BACT|nr:hypothetical protein [Polyangium jinanense]MDC3960112.1 hypothetical protein [Polyangium jinanense]MDC3984429.1 hypothetical protein [Polyangium jinanense]
MAEKEPDEDKDEVEGEGESEPEAEAKADAPKAEAKAEAKASAPAKAAPAKAPTKKPKAGKATPRRAQPPSSASLGKSMVLFVVVVGTLAAGFALLGQERGGGGPRGPTWKPGQTVDVEITLVAGDKRELNCAATDEVAGRHCSFETPTKVWGKGDPGDDKKTLRPYTSTDNVQFVAAGLWSEPALSGNLPTTRFSVKCKYTVEGKLKSPTFHWESGWEGQPRGEMLAGVLTGCTLVP